MTEEHNKEIWIFLSHSSEDFNKVRLIRNYLEEKSFRPLMFYLKCLDSEEEIYDLIKREIDARTRFILCDSKNAQASEWVQKEMNYIRLQDPPRSYCKIDLSETEDAIHKQLDSYINQTNIFISYSRTDFNVVKLAYDRLSKYELNTMADFAMLMHGGNYAATLSIGIQHASSNGFFVCIYSSLTSSSQWQKNELEIAQQHGANIVLFAIDDAAYSLISNDPKLSSFHPIKLLGKNDKEKADEITNCILEKSYGLFELLTYAENFRIGRFGMTDVEEADKLVDYVINEAEKSPNPHALSFIGRIYEFGKGGIPVNLKKASEYYSLAIHEPGGPNDKAFINHVRELNAQIYRIDTQNVEKKGLRHTIKRMLHLVAS